MGNLNKHGQQFRGRCLKFVRALARVSTVGSLRDKYCLSICCELVICTVYFVGKAKGKPAPKQKAPSPAGRKLPNDRLKVNAAVKVIERDPFFESR